MLIHQSLEVEIFVDQLVGFFRRDFYRHSMVPLKHLGDFGHCKNLLLKCSLFCPCICVGHRDEGAGPATVITDQVQIIERRLRIEKLVVDAVIVGLLVLLSSLRLGIDYL